MIQITKDIKTHTIYKTEYETESVFFTRVANEIQTITGKIVECFYTTRAFIIYYYDVKGEK